MATTVGGLIGQHPVNPIHDTGFHTDSNKPWTKAYPPITKINVRTRVETVHGHQAVLADFDRAFLSEDHDDMLRLNEPVYPPNYRRWRLQSEEDGLVWFHTEISNIVLAAWARYPHLLQVSHEKPLSETISESQVVDIAYSIRREGGKRMQVAIGEFKRGLIDTASWQGGKLLKSQIGFSQELRGYADKYRCPLVFAFDHSTLLMLQFRASKPSKIRDADCEVDCWVLPRYNPNGTTLRYALYRLLVQGLRRCQGLHPTDSTLNGQHPNYREFYNGRPVWKIDDKFYIKPWGYSRQIDPSYGAFYWVDADGTTPLIDRDGNKIWDTLAFWQPEPTQAGLEAMQTDQYVVTDEDAVGEEEEDIYGL